MSIYLKNSMFSKAFDLFFWALAQKKKLESLQHRLSRSKLKISKQNYKKKIKLCVTTADCNEDVSLVKFIDE